MADPIDGELQNRHSSPDAAGTPRVRTFLKGMVWYNNRNVSIDCTVRDLSETGARLVFSTLVTVPETFELHIPQRNRTFHVKVRRREGFEIGVSFEEQRSGEPRRASDGDLAARVTLLEDELAVMKRLVKRLKDKVLPNEGDV